MFLNCWIIFLGSYLDKWPYRFSNTFVESSLDIFNYLRQCSYDFLKLFIQVFLDSLTIIFFNTVSVIFIEINRKKYFDNFKPWNVYLIRVSYVLFGISLYSTLINNSCSYIVLDNCLHIFPDSFSYMSFNSS